MTPEQDSSAKNIDDQIREAALRVCATSDRSLAAVCELYEAMSFDEQDGLRILIQEELESELSPGKMGLVWLLASLGLGQVVLMGARAKGIIE